MAVLAAVTGTRFEPTTPATEIARFVLFRVQTAAAILAAVVPIDAIAAALLAGLSDHLAATALLA